MITYAGICANGVEPCASRTFSRSLRGERREVQLWPQCFVGGILGRPTAPGMPPRFGSPATASPVPRTDFQVHTCASPTRIRSNTSADTRQVSPLLATNVSSPVLPATSCWAIDRPPGSGMQLVHMPALSVRLSRVVIIRLDISSRTNASPLPITER